MYFGRLRRFVDARESFFAKKTKKLNFLHLQKNLSKAYGKQLIRLIDWLIGMNYKFTKKWDQ